MKSKFKWKQVKQYAFDGINRIVEGDSLLTYPDFNETFKIHTGAILFQLVAGVSQKGKPIAFYSRKLTDPQHRYTVTERELLRIIENMKEFRKI